MLQNTSKRQLQGDQHASRGGRAHPDRRSALSIALIWAYSVGYLRLRARYIAEDAPLAYLLCFVPGGRGQYMLALPRGLTGNTHSSLVTGTAVA
jgi:hypothetical protein